MVMLLLACRTWHPLRVAMRSPNGELKIQRQKVATELRSKRPQIGVGRVTNVFSTSVEKAFSSDYRRTHNNNPSFCHVGENINRHGDHRLANVTVTMMMVLMTVTKMMTVMVTMMMGLMVTMMVTMMMTMMMTMMVLMMVTNIVAIIVTMMVTMMMTVMVTLKFGYNYTQYQILSNLHFTGIKSIYSCIHCSKVFKMLCVDVDTISAKTKLIGVDLHRSYHR